MNKGYSEKVQARKAGPGVLRQDEQWLHLFKRSIDTASDGTYWLNAEGRFLYANEAGCKALGYNLDEILQMHISDINPRVTPQRWSEVCRVFREKKAYTIESVHRRKDGTVFPVELSSTYVKFGNDEFFSGFARDISDRRQAEEQLRTYRERLEELVLKRTAEAKREMHERMRAEEDKLRQYAVLKAQTEASRDGILIVGEDGRIILHNRKFSEIWRISPEQSGEASGEQIHHYLQDQVANTDEFIKQVRYLKDNKDVQSEDVVELTGGRFFHQYSTPIHDDEDAYVGRIWYYRDITEQKQAVDALMESEKRYKRITEAITDYIYSVRIENNAAIETRHGAGCETVTGYTEQEFTADPNLWIRMVVEEDRSRVTDLVQQVLAGKAAPALEHRIVRKDGSLRWIRNTPVQKFDQQGRLQSYDGLIQDITEHKAAQEALKNYSEQLRMLSLKLMEAREAERRHIAHELHDEIGQELTGLKLSVDKVRRTVNGEAAKKLEMLQQDITSLMVRVRDLSLNLRPSLLDDYGVLPAVQWHFGRYTGQTGVKVNFIHQGMERRFLPEIEIVVFRVVQEALTNTARHAVVDAVNVSIIGSQYYISVKIEDSGAGFNAESVLKDVGTFGLTGLRERVREVGGNLLVRSAPGAGTQLTITIPLQCQPPEGRV